MARLSPDQIKFIFVPGTTTAPEKGGRTWSPRWVISVPTPTGHRLVGRAGRPVWVQQRDVGAVLRSLAARTWAVGPWPVGDNDTIPEEAKSLLSKNYAEGGWRLASPEEIANRGETSDVADYAQALDAYEAERATARLAGRGLVVQADAAPPAAGVAAPAEVYHYNGSTSPWATPSMLVNMVAADRAGRHLVWKPGMAGWTPAIEIPEVAAQLPPVPPPFPVATAPTGTVTPAALEGMVAQAVQAALAARDEAREDDE